MVNHFLSFNFEPVYLANVENEKAFWIEKKCHQEEKFQQQM